MRLIDADALQKEHMKYNDGKRLMLIDVALTVDAVEVVRCKECKHFDEGHKVCKRAFNIAYQLKPTDYCSYGERKEE